MEHYTNIIAKVVSDNSDVSQGQVQDMMQDGTLILPEEALSMKLIHAIDEPKLPQDARTWQV